MKSCSNDVPGWQSRLQFATKIPIRIRARRKRGFTIAPSGADVELSSREVVQRDR